MNDRKQTASATRLRSGEDDERSLREKLEFQRLISSLSTRFISLSTDNIDEGLRDALKAICRFADTDRAAVVLFDEEHSAWSISHEWHKPGLEDFSDILGAVTGQRFPWGIEQLSQGRMLAMPTRHQLPEQALREAKLISGLGLKSFLIVPILDGGRLVAYAGFASVEGRKAWSHDLATLLSLVAQMFCNTLERKRTEEALRTAESRFRSLLRSDVVGVWVGHRDGRILEANPYVLAKLGYSRDDLRSGTARWDVLASPDFAEEDRNRIFALRESGYAGPWETEVLDRHGRPFPVLAGVARLEDEPGCFLAITHDMSDLSAARSELRESYEFDRFVARLSTHFINLAPDQVDGAINEALQEVCEFVNVQRCSVYRFADDGRSAHRTHGWVAPDDPVDLDEIAELRISNFRRWTERLLRGQVILIPDSMELDDAPDSGRRLLISRGIRTVAGVPTMLGGSSHGCMLFHSVGRTKHWSEKAVSTLRVIGEIIVNAVERKRINEEISTLNRELEQRVRTRTAQLQASNRELEAFSYSVSHDLRGPLRGIDGFSEILIEEYGPKLDRQAQELLQRTREASQRMTELVDSMLELSRISRTDMSWEPLDLGAIAKEVLDNLRESDPGRAVSLRLASNLAARGEPRLLRVLMENLLGNAWKFTSKREVAEIRVGVDRIDKEAAFYVADNGAGFNPEQSDKLFTPFQRLHAESDFSGTGVGLATAERIVHRHGGRIWAVGKPGHGASFFFTLPEHPA